MNAQVNQSKIILYLVTLHLILFSTEIRAQESGSNRAIIVGNVLDSKSKLPVKGAKVHVAGSLERATTNNNGYFVLRNIPVGDHVIVITNLEHTLKKKIVKVRTAGQIEVDVRLRTRIIEYKMYDPVNRQVGLRKRDRQKHLQRFQKVLLGSDSARDDMQLLNPLTPEFASYPEVRFFEVSASDIVSFKNRKLGYLVHIFLEEFKLRDKEQSISYVHFFEELSPANEREQKQWERARKRVHDKFLRGGAKPKLGEMLPFEYGIEDNQSLKSQNLVKAKIGIAGAKVQVQESNYYEDSLNYTRSGNWAKALNGLQKAHELSVDKGAVDPKIGFDFIRLVAQNKLTDFHQKATELYLWGISEAGVFEHKDLIQGEVKRLEILLTEEQKKEWAKLFEEENIALFDRIREFWARSDPVPSTIKNERLIEHWERIDYAQRNFTEANTTVYGTDDRGNVYVKYGEPETRFADSFGKEIDEMKALNMEEHKRLVDIRTHPLYNSPEFELWIYRDLVSGDTARFFFGREGGIGPFGLRYGVGDFIPEDAYAFEGKMYHFENTIGPNLEWNYYLQLRNEDEFFLQRLREIESRREIGRLADIERIRSSAVQGTRRNDYDPISSVNIDRKLFARYDRNDPAKANAPTTSSLYDKLISPLNLKYFVSRILDKTNKPALGIISYAVPMTHSEEVSSSLLYDLMDQNSYDLRNTLVIHDRQWFEIDRIVKVPSEYKTNLSAFYVPHLPDATNYQVSSIVREEISGTDRSENSVTMYGEFAGSKEYITELEPLSADKSFLEISDLVLGDEMREGYEEIVAPFPLLPNDRIKSQENLMVYIEAYHLFVNSDNKSFFTVEYQLSRKGVSGFIRRLFGRGRDRVLSSQAENIESLSSTAKQLIAFDISDLSPGDYEMTVTVRDALSGQSKSRTGKIMIIE